MVIKNNNLSYFGFFKSSYSLVFSQIVKAFLAILVSTVFARFTSIETYGTYQFIFSLITTFTIFSLPGMNSAMISEVVHGRDGAYKRNIFLSIKYSFLIIPIFFVVSIYFIFIKSNFGLAILIFLTALLIPFYFGFNPWISFYQAKKYFHLIAINQLTISIFSSFLIILLIILFPNNLFILILFPICLAILLNFIFYKFSIKYITNSNFTPNWDKYGFFLTYITIPRTLLSNLDLLVIGFFLGVGELAIYGVGVKIVLQMQNLIKSLLFTLTPYIAKGNLIKMKQYFIMFLLSLIFSIVLYFLLPFIVKFLFSSKYVDSIYLSQIVVLFLPFFIFENIYRKHIKFFLKNKKVQLMDSFISPFFNLIILFLLLFFFGLVGLAFARGLKSFINFIVLFVLRKLFIIDVSSK